jgi:FkbM family methyltransferase
VNALLRLVRRLATAPGFRRLTTVGPLLRFSFALRGTLVESPVRFALNEVRPGGAIASYRLRGSGISIVIRHHTADVLVLDEIFSQREYEFPSPVARVLDGPARPLTIVDLGANIGLFGAYALTRYPNAIVLAVEPDPANAAIHARAIDANPSSRWTLSQAAAAAAPGTMRFRSGGFTRSHAADEDDEAIVVEQEDVLPLMERADLVKIDIEGGEWALLADPRFALTEALAVVLEYHPEHCPGSQPRAEAEHFLGTAGFEVVRGPSKPEFGTGVLWGWRSTVRPEHPVREVELDRGHDLVARRRELR